MEQLDGADDDSTDDEEVDEDADLDQPDEKKPKLDDDVTSEPELNSDDSWPQDEGASIPFDTDNLLVCKWKEVY